MRFSDEMLMAYADGELDLVARAEIEAAMARDPEVARIVERHRAAAAQIRGAYDAVLEEPVPDRLAALVAIPGAAPTVDLAARRGARRFALGPLRLPAWAAMAASLAIGLFVGMLVMRGTRGALRKRGRRTRRARRARHGAGFSARVRHRRRSGVRVGFSFRDRDGDYCRTFQLQRDISVAGLACRSGDAWQLQVLAAAPAPRARCGPQLRCRSPCCGQ